MRFLIPSLLAFLLLCSCAKTNGGGQHATVELRDGTSVAGTVLSSSPSELQIAGDDKLTRTIPMSQVRSIEYDDTAAAAPGNPPASAAAPSAPAAPGAAPVRPRRQLEHRDHYHPSEQAVTTRTHELPVGTEVSVRN